MNFHNKLAHALTTLSEEPLSGPIEAAIDMHTEHHGNNKLAILQATLQDLTNHYTPQLHTITTRPPTPNTIGNREGRPLRAYIDNIEGVLTDTNTNPKNRLHDSIHQLNYDIAHLKQDDIADDVHPDTIAELESILRELIAYHIKLATILYPNQIKIPRRYK